jgi:hypothetical protein
MDKRSRASERARAYKILGFSDSGTPPKDVLKKRYYILALKYHPDKNPSPEALEKFQEINEAYNTLAAAGDENAAAAAAADPPPTTWALYFTNFFQEFFKNPATISIIQQIADGCFARAFELLAELDISQMINLYRVLENYRHILGGATERFFAQLEKEIHKKSENVEYIVLNPSVENLLDCDLYKYVLGEYTLLVPLWHHELVYETECGELTINCVPELPDGVSIDENNNLYVTIRLCVYDVLDKPYITFYIGEHPFCISVSQIAFMRNQTVVLKNCGIPRAREKNICDVSARQNIYVNIELY